MIATDEKETPDVTDTLVGPEGVRLAYREWRTAEDVSPRGAVLLVHGYGEHMRRYGRLARQLTAGGFAVGGMDLRGFGLSEGTRAFVRDYADYIADLRLSEARFRRDLPADTPLFLYAHSMGGLVALLYAERFPVLPLAGMVLSGPLIGVGLKVPAWQMAFGRAVNRMNPKFRMEAPLDPKVLTHDPEEQAKLTADTLFPRRVTLSWFFATERALLELQPDVERIVWPTLWLIPGVDRIVSTPASRAFFDRLPHPEQHTWQDYPGLFHELHNERRADRDRVCADVLQWMTAQIESGSVL
ncbi:MAG TPA: lysophospholipase [Chthonomonadaceae bacterium]|nr:lysophospholipase [Chthonomonadaceae bacterium]